MLQALNKLVLQWVLLASLRIYTETVPRVANAEVEEAKSELPKGKTMTRHEWVLSRIKPTDTVLHVGASGNDWELEMRWFHTEPLHKKIADKAEKTVAIDISELGVRTLRAHGYEAYVANVESISPTVDWYTAEFDVIVAGEIIEHLTNIGDAFENMSQFLSPNGKMVFTTPNMLGFWSFVTYGILGKHEDHDEHVCGFKGDFIPNIAKRFDMRVTDLTYTDADDLGKRRFKWIKEIPEKMWPHTKPILCFELSPLE